MVHVVCSVIHVSQEHVDLSTFNVLSEKGYVPLKYSIFGGKSCVLCKHIMFYVCEVLVALKVHFCVL